MLCPSLLINKVDVNLLQQCRGSDVRQLSLSFIASNLNAPHEASMKTTHLILPLFFYVIFKNYINIIP